MAIRFPFKVQTSRGPVRFIQVGKPIAAMDAVPTLARCACDEVARDRRDSLCSGCGIYSADRSCGRCADCHTQRYPMLGR